MPGPDIPAVKRAGLPVDLERLAAEGDAWLSADDRYALKTHGICAQLQPGRFMVRIRVAGGVISTDQVRGAARLTRSIGPDWLHLTTRQNLELHWVEDRKVPALLDGLAQVGLSTRSACGHTLRNVMCSEDAGLGLDEPFDCLPDARAVSDAIVARSAELNCSLPSRVNLAFGGSSRCREDAWLNDGAFVSVVRDGVAGYELLAGGSLGKAPSLAVPLADFVPRSDVLAAAEALIEVFIAHGDFDTPARGRMKFVVERLGAAAFRAAWDQAFAARRELPRPDPVEVEVLAEPDRADILRRVPAGGWSAGVRPQRRSGKALVTIELPMGDASSAELELIADLADRWADGFLTLGRDQDVILRDVDLDGVAAIREALAARSLHLLGEGGRAAVRACTGSAVCALGVTTAPDAGRAVRTSAGLARNSSLRVNVSGCPNSCAQHQAADIGLAGSKVRVGGRARDGYQLYVGADLTGPDPVVGTVVGRVAAEDVTAAVDAVIGAWEAVRRGGETLGATIARVGHDAIAAHVAAVMDVRWAEGPEPDPDAVTVA